MKGVVFVELIRMAETAMGEDAVDDIAQRALSVRLVTRTGFG